MHILQFYLDVKRDVVGNDILVCLWPIETTTSLSYEKVYMLHMFISIIKSFVSSLIHPHQ